MEKFTRRVGSRTNGLRRRHLLCFMHRFHKRSRVRATGEKSAPFPATCCPEQATQPLSALLQRSIRFLSRSHTHIAIVRLTASYPTFVGNDTGLLCSADWTCQVV